MDASRSTVLGTMLVLLVATSGCLGVITGSEPLVLSADDAGVTDATLESTDFELEESQTEWVNRTVEQAGQEREIRVRNHVTFYERPVEVGADGPTFGFFAVISTPEASVAGQSFNPLGRMSHQELVEQFAGESADVRDIEREDSRELTVLGEEAEIVRFSGVVEESGVEVPVYIEVTRVVDDDDYVLALGLYPQEATDEVRPEVTTLFEGIEH